MILPSSKADGLTIFGVTLSVASPEMITAVGGVLIGVVGVGVNVYFKTKELAMKERVLREQLEHGNQ